MLWFFVCNPWSISEISYERFVDEIWRESLKDKAGKIVGALFEKLVEGSFLGDLEVDFGEFNIQL